MLGVTENPYFSNSDKAMKEAAEAMIQQAKLDAQAAANAEIDKARVSFEQEKNARLNLISQNIENIENAIKKKTFDSKLV